MEGREPLQCEHVPKQLVRSQKQQGGEQIKAWGERERESEKGRGAGEMEGHPKQSVPSARVKYPLSESGMEAPPACYVTRLQRQQRGVQDCTLNCVRPQPDRPEAGMGTVPVFQVRRRRGIKNQ